MSSQVPASTKPSDSGSYQLPALGSRSLMTTAQSNPSTYQTLPSPSSSDNQPIRLPPPSHLDPPFAPHAPQARPLYSDFPARQHALHAQQPYTHGPTPATDATWPLRGPGQRELPGGAISLPPLCPPDSGRNAGITGTTYEPLSPAEHASHGPPGKSSLFDDSTYSSRPYAPAFQPHHSPTGSHHSSGTSSSGQLLRTQAAARPSAPQGDTSTSKGKAKDQEEFERYIFKVRQQPEAARACGFGERDRRVIDPPAIVQLSFKDFDPESPSDLALLQYPFHIAHCSLFTVQSEPSADTSLSDVTSVPDPSKVNALCRRLMGTLVASPFIGIDPEVPSSKSENARLGCFFIFPDLSVRQTGRYRLRFTLMKVPMHELIEGGQGSIASFVDSEIFEVFVAGSFPGMSASSRLIKELKRQGAAVSLKKGVTPGKSTKRSGNASEKSGSEGSEDADTSSTQARRRRRRG